MQLLISTTVNYIKKNFFSGNRLKHHVTVPMWKPARWNQATACSRLHQPWRWLLNINHQHTSPRASEQTVAIHGHEWSALLDTLHMACQQVRVLTPEGAVPTVRYVDFTHLANECRNDVIYYVQDFNAVLLLHIKFVTSMLYGMHG